MKITKPIVHVGSSLGVIIDQKYCRKIGLKEGDWIELDVKKV